MKRRFGLICLTVLLTLCLAIFLSSCDNTDKKDCGEGNHSWGEWEDAGYRDCVTSGKLIRTCTVCEATENKRSFGPHDYGEFIWGKKATYFEDGIIDHYQCGICDQYLDYRMDEVSTITIPKLTPDFSVCLDGAVAGELKQDKADDTEITLSLSDLSVNEGQTVNICIGDDPSSVLEYTVAEWKYSSLGVSKGNIDPVTKKVRITATCDLRLVLKKDGTTELSMNGYIPDGLVVEITSLRTDNMPMLFPMSYTDYYDDPEMKAYVFGLFGSDGTTSLRVIDMNTDAVYDYDDLSDTNDWDKWSYSRGKNGEIVFADGVLSDWWLAFDIGGDGKITLTRHNLPNTIKPTLTVFGGDTIEMEKVTLEPGGDEYNYYTWQLTDEVFSRQDEWLDTVDLENIYIYRGILRAEAGDSFYIGDDYSKKPWTLLSTVYVEGNAIDKYVGSIKEGYHTKPAYGITLKKAGTYVVEYLPYCNVINIIEVDLGDGYLMYLDGGFVELEESGGRLTYELEADAYTNIAFLKADYSFLPVSISSDTPSGIANVIESEGATMLFFSKAGKYTLSYNISSGVVTITPKEGTETDPPEEDPVLPMSIYISYDNKLTLVENPDNPNEMCYLGLTLGAWDEFKVWDTNRSYISDMTLGAGTKDIVTNGTTITFQKAGKYDFYINKTTHEVRFVASGGTESGGTEGGGTTTSEKYIIYHEGSFISVYSEGNTFKYTGLAVSAGDYLSIKDSDYEELPISFDPAVDTSLVKLHESYNMFSFVWNCKADLTYNTETGVLMIDIYDVTYANALVYLFYSDTYEEAHADENGIVSKRFEFTESANIYINNSAFETLPMILHEDSDRSLVTVMEFNEGNMLYIPNAGIYDLTYDLNSKIFTFELVTEVAE